jgi:hypothetical protein
MSFISWRGFETFLCNKIIKQWNRYVTIEN